MSTSHKRDKKIKKQKDTTKKQFDLDQMKYPVT